MSESGAKPKKTTDDIVDVTFNMDRFLAEVAESGRISELHLMSDFQEYTAEEEAEYAKRQTKRKARELQRSTGMKYTEALRQIQREEEEGKP